MLIYWSMIFVTVFIGFMEKLNAHKNSVINAINKYQIKKNSIVSAFIIALYVVLMVGIRTKFGDTGTYIASFKRIPICTLSEIPNYLSTIVKEKGFALYNVLFKSYISNNYHWWLLSIAAISGICVYRTFYKKSIDFTFTSYLFIASTMFTWMMNGMRQFIVISVIFAFSNWIFERKTVKFIILVLIMSTIHQTAIIWIPIYFIVNGKPWRSKQIILTLISLGAIFIFSSIPTLSNALLNSANYDLTYLANDDGANKIRVLVAGVPTIIAFCGRKAIAEKASPYINMCINISLIGTMLYAFASVTSGILIGRLPAYFEIFNFILLPWLIKNVFIKESSNYIKILCYILYAVFFFYQMQITWNSTYYSDLLNFGL